MGKPVATRHPLSILGLIALLAAVSVMLSGALARAQAPALPSELERVRSALQKYQDPVVAVHDGYFSTLGCVEYPSGGMGALSQPFSDRPGATQASDPRVRTRR